MFSQTESSTAKFIRKNVVIIDDDSNNNYIFLIIIKKLCRPALVEVTDFTQPKEGISFIKNLLSFTREPVILFLDINMPELNGWGVLDKLKELPVAAKELLTIYMYSSSDSMADKKKAATYPMVKRYIVKPISVYMDWLREEIIGSVTV